MKEIVAMIDVFANACLILTATTVVALGFGTIMVRTHGWLKERAHK